ncbi:MAG: methyltransferase domain-containing protein [Nanoarchaeota archaeon]
MQDLKNYFDKNYKGKKFYWGLSPSKIVVELLKYKQNGDVLDLGCGEGRNALFLAKKGFSVVGIDSSNEGIKKFLQLAKENNVSVEGQAEDIKDYQFTKKFDVIISIATLHFLKKKDISLLINKMKENTKKKGLNIISVFTEENPFKGFPYLFKKNELKETYKDWSIIYYREFMTPLEHHGKGESHRHGIAVIVAQKNESNKI